MKKSVMKKWVSALRSGELVNGKDELLEYFNEEGESS